MPAKKARKYGVGQWVEVGNGKKKKPLVGEILTFERTYRYTRSRIERWNAIFDRENRSTVIQYDILFTNGTRKWIYQEQILRVQPDPSQQDLETRARELYGEDYL